MALSNLDEEKDAVDYITDCMFSISFLESYTNTVFDKTKSQMPIIDFYNAWLRGIKTPELKMPFSPGVFLGYLFVGILYAKENWFDLIPDIELKDASDWGVDLAKPVNPKNLAIKLKQFSRRIRNSLGHGFAKITVPKGIKKEEMYDKITFTFHDVNMRDAADTFDVELTMSNLMKFIKRFQSVIHSTVRNKK